MTEIICPMTSKVMRLGERGTTLPNPQQHIVTRMLLGVIHSPAAEAMTITHHSYQNFEGRITRVLRNFLLVTVRGFALMLFRIQHFNKGQIVLVQASKSFIKFLHVNLCYMRERDDWCDCTGLRLMKYENLHGMWRLQPSYHKVSQRAHLWIQVAGWDHGRTWQSFCHPWWRDTVQCYPPRWLRVSGNLPIIWDILTLADDG